MNATHDRLGRAPALAAAIGAFALAALVMPTTPGMGDSAELVLALALAGIPHPTGYPFYVLAGHLFVRIAHALGIPWVLAANLWSATGAAVAVGAYTRLVQLLVATLEDEGRLTGLTPVSGIAKGTAVAFPVVALALNPVWLDSATKAEIYGWSNAALAMAAAFMLGRLRRLATTGSPVAVTPDRMGDAALAAEDLRAACGWGLLCGLCATQHATSLLFALPMSAALVVGQVKAGRWRASLLMVAVGAALVPLASYGWIAWRAAHPARFQWPVEPTFASWWLHVRGAAYTGYLGRFAPTPAEWALIRQGLLPWILPGMSLGSLLALRTTSSAVRWSLLALLGGAALQVAFIVSYGVADPTMYFLPVLMPSLLVAAPGLLWLARRTSGGSSMALATGLVLWLGAWSLPRAWSERTALAQVDAGFRDAWRRIPFSHGIVLWADDHYTRFVLLQVLEGQRPDLYVDNPDMLILPVPREAFRRRFGFDPTGGLRFRTPRDLERVPEVIRERARVPVLVLPH